MVLWVYIYIVYKWSSQLKFLKHSKIISHYVIRAYHVTLAIHIYPEDKIQLPSSSKNTSP